MLGSFALLLADADAPKSQSTGMDSLIFLLAPLLLFFVFIVLPMRRDSKVRREMLSTLKKGDRVLVNGFLIGNVMQIIKPDKPQAQEEVLLKADENANVKLRVLRGAITQILKSDDSKDAKEGS